MSSRRSLASTAITPAANASCAERSNSAVVNPMILARGSVEKRSQIAVTAVKRGNSKSITVTSATSHAGTGSLRIRSFRSSLPYDYITPRGRILMCRNGDISLEAEPKGKLHRARAADLEEWTQLAHHIGRIEAVSKRFGRGAKTRTGRESQPPGSIWIAGISEVGMIEDVERFRAELQAQALGQPEFPMEREVDLPRAETTQNVAAKVAVEPVWWNRKRSAIEALAARKAGPVEIQRLTWHDVRPASIIIGAVARIREDKIGRQRRSREKDTVCRPVAEEQARDPSVGGRQRGDYRSIQAVPNIEVRRTPRPGVERE
jgi:hypothetical protein